MEWISVNDKLPEIHQKVFAKGIFGLDNDESFGVGELIYKNGEYLQWSAGSRSLISVTYWSEFSEPPKE